ncbi:unnamed protein product [Mortierella alpina]
MVRRQVSGLDREDVYSDLRTRLTALTTHPNVMVCFHALYAKQALAIIGNDESLSMSAFHRGKLAFTLAGNLSNVANSFDPANAESAYQNFKELFDIAIQDHWYQGLIYVDYLIAVVQMDVAVKESANKFLSALGEITIPLVLEVIQGALQRLGKLDGSAGGLKDDATTFNTRQSDLRPVWDPTWFTDTKGILLKTVPSGPHH